MAPLKKNLTVLIILLVAGLMVLLVIWIYDKRIHQLEKKEALKKNPQANEILDSIKT